MKTADTKNDRPKDINAKRRRISVDQNGKPLLKTAKDETEISPADFKLSSFNGD
jgi:hypothetical protein